MKIKTRPAVTNFETALRLTGLAGLLAVVLSLAGCGAAQVTPQTMVQPVSTAPPSEIVVYDFAVSGSEVTQNQSVLQRAYRAVSEDSDQQQQASLKLGHDTAADLSQALVEQLSKLGFKVVTLERGTTPPDGSLIVDGKFVDIDEGNRARRLVIGFGAGASKLDTEVSIYQVAGGQPAKILDFTTHADSGKMPGAAVTMGAGAAAQGGATAAMTAANVGVGGLKAYHSTLGSLADSTAKQITAYFSQYAANQGWISADKVVKAKVEQAQE